MRQTPGYKTVYLAHRLGYVPVSNSIEEITTSVTVLINKCIDDVPTVLLFVKFDFTFI
jgi:hypothetical protein